ncbi:ABC transporter substrate-binding protein, partial [Streptomyces sp. NPDC054956]
MRVRHAQDEPRPPRHHGPRADHVPGGPARPARRHGIGGNNAGDSGPGTLYFGEGLSTVNVNVTDMEGPLGDVRVRRALSLALDRTGFVKAGLAGAGTATNSLTTRAAWAAAPEHTLKTAFDGLPPTGQDIEQAKALIKEAGATGKTLTMATSSIG